MVSRFTQVLRFNLLKKNKKGKYRLVYLGLTILKYYSLLIILTTTNWAVPTCWVLLGNLHMLSNIHNITISWDYFCHFALQEIKTQRCLITGPRSDSVREWLQGWLNLIGEKDQHWDDFHILLNNRWQKSK